MSVRGCALLCFNACEKNETAFNAPWSALVKFSEGWVFFFPTYVLIFSVLMRGILRLWRPHSPEINIVHSSYSNSYLLLSCQPIIGELSWEGLGWWVLNGCLPYELTQDGTVLLHIVHEVGWLFIDLKTKVIWNICQGTKKQLTKFIWKPGGRKKSH